MSKKTFTLVNIDGNSVGPIGITYCEAHGKTSGRQEYIEVFQGTPYRGASESVLASSDCQKAIRANRLLATEEVEPTVPEESPKDADDNTNDQTGSPAPDAQAPEEAGNQVQAKAKNTQPAPTAKKKQNGKGKSKNN